MSASAVIAGASLAFNLGKSIFGGGAERRQRRRRRRSLQNAYDKFSTDISDDLQAQTEIDYYEPEIGMDIDNMKLNLNQTARESKSSMDAVEAKSGLTSSGFSDANRSQFKTGLQSQQDQSLRGIYDKYFQETERAQGVIDDIERRNQELYYRTIV